jgi:hypothetical protein
MEDVNLAHKLMESSNHIGKVVLDIKGGQLWIYMNTKLKLC